MATSAKRYAMLALASLSLAACSTGGGEAKPKADLAIDKVHIEVVGYEWGPSVPKLILALNQEVSEVDVKGLEVKTAGVTRKVEKAYPSDEKGKPVDGASKYIALDLEVTYTFMAEDNAQPFIFNMETFMNEWAPEYEVEVTDLAVGDQKLSIKEDAIKQRIMNETDVFNVREKTTGKYKNPMTGKEEEVTLNYAAYEPQNLKKSKEKSPLVIWLHGQGEGGTDVDITLLGNEVTALAQEEIQNQYSATGNDKEKGAYVLAVQTPTYWMDEGDGTNGPGSGVSRYTEALMDTIKAYVESNDDIDPNRIYLGGCSNGGYMTMNMAVTYPDYFAAAYPIAEAYSYYEYERNEDGTYIRKETDDTTPAAYELTTKPFLTDEKIAAIKDLPMWFIQSANDETVVAERFVEPSYQALVKAGDNKWFSYYETVKGKDIEGNEYLGHWSWLYFFNNQVTGVQDVEKVKTATDLAAAYQPSDASFGGDSQVKVNDTSYKTIFEWMNDQSK